MLQADTFRDKLIESGVLDPLGAHHEFAYGTHGRKLDFDLITEGDPLYADWVSANVDSLRSFPALPRAVLGIANGTNRLASDVASELGITALFTEKVSPREVVLTSESIQVVTAFAPADEITALEDVGTSGGTTYSGLRDVQWYGAHNVNALITWQRTEVLSALAAANILSRSIIFEPLPTYTLEQCMEEGYCAQGWALIAHN